MCNNDTGKNLRVFLVLLILLFFSKYTIAQEYSSSNAYPIFIDGLFDDWANIPLCYSDPEGDNSVEDFSEIKFANDENYLYINFSFYSENFVLQGSADLQKNNKIKMYIDLDNNPNTGLTVDEIGADIEWCFGQRYGIYHHNAVDTFYQEDLWYCGLPSYGWNTFEITINRNSSKFTFDSSYSPDTVSIVFKESDPEGDRFPDTGHFKYIFNHTTVEPFTPIPLERFNPADIRLFTNNTWNRIKYFPDRFESILKSLAPDVFAFQRMNDASYFIMDSLLSNWFPNKTWYKGGRYGSEPRFGDELTVWSIFPILNEAQITESGKMVATLLDTKAKLGKNLLFVNMHLLDSVGEDRDSLRQDDADQFVRFIRELISETGPFPFEKGTPVVMMGDCNLYGSIHLLQTLRDGNIKNNSRYGEDFPFDWDGTSVEDLDSRQNSTRTGFTYEVISGEFWQGKLDYIFYTNSVLTIGNYFVLNTWEMKDEDLAFYGLDRYDTRIASGHLPRVMDIVSVHPTRVSTQNNQVPKEFYLYQNYPNPFNPSTKISYSILERNRVILKVYNTIGEQIVTLVDEEQNAGIYTVSFNNSGLASGIYFYKLQAGDFVENKKMILLK